MRIAIAALLAAQLGCASPWVRIPLGMIAAGAKGGAESYERAKDREARSRETKCITRDLPDGTRETVCK